MEEIIKKLLDNKIVTTFSIGAILFLILSIFLVNSGITGIYLNLSIAGIGLFSLLAVIIGLFTSKKEKEKYTVSSEQIDLLEYLSENSIETKDKLIDVMVLNKLIRENNFSYQIVSEILKEIKERKPLIWHSFFKEIPKRLKYKIQDKTKNLSLGKRYSICIYLFNVINIMCMAIANFLYENRNIQFSEKCKVNWGDFTSRFNESRFNFTQMIIEDKSIRKEFEEAITNYNRQNMDNLMRTIKEIITDDFYHNDYSKMNSILHACIGMFIILIDVHIDDILKLNGLLEDGYSKIEDWLKGKGKDQASLTLELNKNEEELTKYLEDLEIKYLDYMKNGEKI